MGLFKKREKTKFVYDEEGNLVPVHYVEKKGEFVEVDPKEEAQRRDSEKIKKWIKEDKREKARLKGKDRARKRLEWERKKREIARIRSASIAGRSSRGSGPRQPSKSSKVKYIIRNGKAYPVVGAGSKKKSKKGKKKSSGLNMKDFKWPDMRDWKL